MLKGFKLLFCARVVLIKENLRSKINFIYFHSIYQYLLFRIKMLLHQEIKFIFNIRLIIILKQFIVNFLLRVLFLNIFRTM
jgi:hypothetical protein